MLARQSRPQTRERLPYTKLTFCPAVRSCAHFLQALARTRAPQMRSRHPRTLCHKFARTSVIASLSHRTAIRLKLCDYLPPTIRHIGFHDDGVEGRKHPEPRSGTDNKRPRVLGANR